MADTADDIVRAMTLARTGKTRTNWAAFGGAEIGFRWEFDPACDLGAATRAVHAVLALGPAALNEAAPHVHAYYLDVQNTLGGEALENGERPPEGPDDIWHLVQPRFLHIAFEDLRDPGTAYAQLDANCAWEPDHGLTITWQGGDRLVRVSGFDGHLTNQHADSRVTDPSIIYWSSVPRFVTRAAQ